MASDDSGREALPTEQMRPLVLRRPPASLPLLDQRYQLMSVLGTGGMAHVYIARDLRLDRLCAVKVLRPEIAADSEQVERFKREALMLAMVDSPYVITVQDIVIAPAATFLVMRYVAGRTIAQELTARTRLEPRRAVAIALRVLHGLSDLHACEILHRDVKPTNVWLGDDESVLLIDLGAALDRRRDVLTRPGFVIGTPELMSPEQRSGAALDERVDLFQAGLLFAQMLTGMPRPDALALAAVPGELGAIVKHAMAPLAERYRSADDMTRALVHATY